MVQLIYGSLWKKLRRRCRPQWVWSSALLYKPACTMLYKNKLLEGSPVMEENLKKRSQIWNFLIMPSNKPLVFSSSFPTLISSDDGRMLYCLRCAMALRTLYVNVHTTLAFPSAQIIKEPYILRTHIALIILSGFCFFYMFFPQGGVEVLVLCVGTNKRRE